MRGKLIKIERPKGYVNIDEVYKMLDGVDKEEDCEYGDYGEVLSNWATCDYGEVLEAISCCDVIQAIPLDKVEQAREEIKKKIGTPVCGEYIKQGYDWGLREALEILDKLIAESEN